MNESEKDSGASKRPSFITKPDNPGANVSQESSRVLSSLGGTSTIMVPPPRRRYGPGIWIGAALMFAAGGASTLMYRSGSSDQAAVCEPAIQMAEASPPPAQGENAEVLSAPSAPAAEAPAAAEVPPETANASASATPSAAADDDDKTTAAPAAAAAVSATPPANDNATEKPEKPAVAAAISPKHAPTSNVVEKNKREKTASTTSQTPNKIAKKRNVSKTDLAHADPDVDVIEALLRYGPAIMDHNPTPAPRNNTNIENKSPRNAGS